MRILVSNDDGYLSPGLDALVDAASGFGEVTVVAPDRDRSGASNSLTLDAPLHAVKTENGYIRVDGTPTDCVHLAITGLLKNEPDMVISGINLGANLGDDVLYSGTVAAATEGRFLGLPAMAVSITAFEPENLQAAGRVVATLLNKLQADPLPQDIILNVNIPDLPWNEIKGFQSTRLGHRH
ncbi:MAG TPA: 5'/3'-nucleotidase SurE, partial [Thiotrichales bacterium]|nr:5'/3'-nucleotidase SurE [Thiotrichales bacterium]